MQQQFSVNSDHELGSNCSCRTIPIDERKTSRIMTKYEMARILGLRALQLSQGHPPLVVIGNEKDTILIAERELREHKLSLHVRRNFEDGTWEDWNVRDLLIRDEIGHR